MGYRRRTVISLMAKIIKKILTGILFLIIATTSIGCGGSSNSADDYGVIEDPDTAYVYVKEAFTYTFPLVLMHLTMVRATNAMHPVSNEAPINQFWHQEKIADVYYGYNREANRDVVCSQCFIDLSRDAVVFEKPTTDRFCLFELFDAYTNCVSVMGPGTESDARKYIITGPDFNGSIPSGLVQIKCPTSLAWLIGRIRCFGEEDLPNVKAIQQGIDAKELNRYLTNSKPPYNSYDYENNFVPFEKLKSLSAEEYFNLANELMLKNPPASIDAEIINKIRRVRVGPGLKFRADILGDSTIRRYEQMKEQCWSNEWPSNSRVYYITPSSAYDPGLWSFYAFSPKLWKSDFGKNYQYRAFCAYNYLCMHPNSACVDYYKYKDDTDGSTLIAGKKYRLVFQKNVKPPINIGSEDYGFWSITLYDSRGYIITDGQDYFASISDKTGIEVNGSGTIEVMIEPMGESNSSARFAEAGNIALEDSVNTANLLYTRGNGSFYAIMRIYLPHEAVVNGFWPAPRIERIEEE